MNNALTLDRGAHIPPSTLRGRLRDAREWRGLEQADIAAELGVGRSTVSNYERGVTDPSKLVVNAWAVICDVDVEWLKTGEAPHDGGTPVAPPTGFGPATFGTNVRGIIPFPMHRIRNGADRGTLATITPIGRVA